MVVGVGMLCILRAQHMRCCSALRVSRTRAPPAAPSCGGAPADTRARRTCMLRAALRRARTHICHATGGLLNKQANAPGCVLRVRVLTCLMWLYDEDASDTVLFAWLVAACRSLRARLHLQGGSVPDRRAAAFCAVRSTPLLMCTAASCVMAAVDYVSCLFSNVAHHCGTPPRKKRLPRGWVARADGATCLLHALRRL